jgi:glyoxylate/hydroxypyruvate reductase A
MREGASLINFARGGVLDTAALVDALDEDRLNHAVLDVFDEEPLPANSPLWNHQKVTVLPHISAPTNRVTASAIVAANVRAFRESGTIPVVVDAARGY